MKAVLILALFLAEAALSAQMTNRNGVNAESVNGVINPAACGAAASPAWCSGADIGAWVNAAIAKACSPGFPRCTLMIPPGNYKQTTTITIPATTTTEQAFFKLQFARGAVVTYTGSGDAIFVIGTIYEGAHTIIEDLHLVGTASAASGVHMQNIYGTILERPVIDNFPNGSGLWFEGAGGDVYSPSISGSLNCINLTSTSGNSPNAIHVFGGEFDSCINGWNHNDAAPGLVHVAQSNLLEGAVFESPRNAVVDTASQNFNIFGNYVEDTSNTSVKLGSPQNVTLAPMILGNFFSSVKTPSTISLNNVRQAQVLGNHDYGNTANLVAQTGRSTLNTIMGSTAFYNQLNASSGSPITLQSGLGAVNALQVPDPTNSFYAFKVDNLGNTYVNKENFAAAYSGAQPASVKIAPAAGAGATAACDTGDGFTCTNLSGVVNLITGSSPSAGDLFTISWRTPFSSNAICQYQSIVGALPLNQDGTVFSTSSSQAQTAGTPSPSTTYKVSYHCFN